MITLVLTKLKAALFQNLGLKALSLMGALMLYSTVHGTQEAQRTLVVDVVGLVPQSNANRVLTSQLPPRARVTLRGQKNVLDELHADDLGTIQVDMRGATDARVELTAELVHVPTGVVVEQVDPPWIDLTWEERITRDVPVQVSVVGTPVSGYSVKGVPSADPALVRVAGPKSDVMVLQHLRAESIDVSGFTEGRHSRLLSIDRPPGRVELEMRAVQVSVDVTREIAKQPFTKLKLAVVGRSNARTAPSEVDVQLSCPPDVLRSLRPEQIVPRVELGNTDKQGSVLLPVIVEVPNCTAAVTPPEAVVRW